MRIKFWTSFVLFCPIKKRSFNLLSVLDLFFRTLAVNSVSDFFKKKIVKETREIYLSTGRKIWCNERGKFMASPWGQVRGHNWWHGNPKSTVDFFQSMRALSALSAHQYETVKCAQLKHELLCSRVCISNLYQYDFDSPREIGVFCKI